VSQAESLYLSPPRHGAYHSIVRAAPRLLLPARLLIRAYMLTRRDVIVQAYTDAYKRADTVGELQSMIFQ
jgi:hypothetical protein